MKFRPAGPPRYEHQKAALRRLIETKGVCALLMDPGLGKTAVALDYASLLALAARPDADGVRQARVLVVGPLAAVDTWALEAPKWITEDVSFWAETLGGSIREKAEALAARDGRGFTVRGRTFEQSQPSASRRAGEHPRALGVRRALVVETRGADGRSIDPRLGPDGLGTAKPRLVLCVLNLDAFKSRQRVGSGTMADVVAEAVKRFRPDLMVVDEGHKIKGAGSNSSRLIARIGDHVPRRILLTGTVMPHSPLDIYGQWRFLEPTAFGDLLPSGERRRATSLGFKRRFAVMGGYMGKDVTGYQNLDELEEIMGRNAIVVRKADALDLPETQDVEVEVHLSPAERAAYDSMLKDLRADVDGSIATAGTQLTKALRLRQITAGHLPLDDGTVRELGQTKARAIASLANDTLEQERRLVIFTVFRHELAQLRSLLRVRGTEVLVIDGDTPKAERLRIRQRFGSDDSTRLILLAQIQTISLSVNELVTARYAIFGSLSQQRDDIVQGRDRLNRIGQERAMTFYFVLAHDTIDRVIYQAHEDRAALEGRVLDYLKSGALEPS